MLTVLTRVPEGLLAVAAKDLHTILPGPTLIHLPGRRSDPLLVSALLHGDEDTGLKAAQQVLANYARRELPRALSLFIGNVAAARENLRRLEHQPDYNRVWLGTQAAQSAESRMMQCVVDDMRARHVFASIDIHNNTGLNPHYACVNRLDQRFLYLASLFARTVVYVTRPLGVQSRAFADYCPALTVECGKPGDPTREAHCAAFVDAVLHLAEFPKRAALACDLDLYHTVGIVKISAGTNFSFSDARADLLLDRDLDHMNFNELPAGTRFGRIHPVAGKPFTMLDENGRDVTDAYFQITESEIRTRRPVTPAMLTLNERAIRQDCLCYLMERLAAPTGDGLGSL
jgi:succinylglutamate desuccinylase